MKPVLVTGITGFLGANFIRRLLDKHPGVFVRGLVRNAGCTTLSTTGAVEILHGDVTRRESLEGKCRGIHTVVHLASKVVASGLSEYRRVNVEGTGNIAECCVREGVQHIIYVSSAATYGFDVARGDEEHVPLTMPATPISRSRYEAEQLLLDLHRRNKIRVTILRPLFVYGNGDRFFIPTILRSLLRFRFMINRGEARFSVVSATDLGDVILGFVTMDPKPVDYPVYHVADGVPVSLGEVVRVLCEELQLQQPSRSIPYGVAVLAMMIAGLKTTIFVQGDHKASAHRKTVSLIELRHRVHLVSYDHYYSTDRLRAALPMNTFTPFATQIRSFIPYYQSVLSDVKQ